MFSPFICNAFSSRLSLHYYYICSILKKELKMKIKKLKPDGLSLPFFFLRIIHKAFFRHLKWTRIKTWFIRVLNCQLISINKNSSGDRKFSSHIWFLSMKILTFMKYTWLSVHSVVSCRVNKFVKSQLKAFWFRNYSIRFNVKYTYVLVLLN